MISGKAVHSCRKLKERQVDLSSSSLYTPLHCFLVLINLTKEIIFKKRSWKPGRLNQYGPETDSHLRMVWPIGLGLHIKNSTIK
jgi:hypothetical protein